MPTSHARKSAELDPKSIEIHFSTEVQRAFGDLEAAVHFSKHFDGGLQTVLQRWATGAAANIHDVLVILPLLAEETFGHIRATGDERAEDAWREICSQISEKGFRTVRRGRQR